MVNQQDLLAEAIADLAPNVCLSPGTDGTVAMELDYNTWLEAEPVSPNAWQLYVRVYGADHGMDSERRFSDVTYKAYGVARVFKEASQGVIDVYPCSHEGCFRKVKQYDDSCIVHRNQPVPEVEEKMYLVCRQCGEAYDSIDTAATHLPITCGSDQGWDLLPESEAM